MAPFRPQKNDERSALVLCSSTPAPNDNEGATAPPTLLTLPPELRIYIWRYVLHSIEPANYDDKDKDPSIYFTVIGHHSCYETLSGICKDCLASRYNAINVSQEEGEEEGALTLTPPKLLSVCKMIYAEALPIYYGENEMFVPYRKDVYDKGTDYEEYERYFDAANYLTMIGDELTYDERCAVRTLTIPFEQSKDFEEMDEVCDMVLDTFPQLRTFRVVVETAAFEGNINILESEGLPKLAAEIQVVVEVTCHDLGNFLSYTTECYEEYVEDLRSDVHGVLDPLVRMARWEKEVKATEELKEKEKKKEGGGEDGGETDARRSSEEASEDGTVVAVTDVLAKTRLTS